MDEFSAMQKDLPRFAQEADFTCGVACARSVLLYLLNVNQSENSLAEKMGVYVQGLTTTEALLEIFQTYGLQAKAAKFNKIPDLQNSMRNNEVVLVSFYDDEVGHYGLIKELDSEKIVLMDPWLARDGLDNTMSLTEFQNRWYHSGETKSYHGFAMRISTSLL